MKKFRLRQCRFAVVKKHTAILICLSFLGCVALNEKQLATLRIGATTGEVKSLIGNPLTQNNAHSFKNGQRNKLNIRIWEYRNLFGQETTLLYFCEDKLRQIEKMQSRTYEWPSVKFECE